MLEGAGGKGSDLAGSGFAPAHRAGGPLLHTALHDGFWAPFGHRLLWRRLDSGIPADVGSTSMSATRRTWLLLVVGAVLGLALGILVSATTDVPFAPEVGLLLGALVGWLSRRVTT